MSCTFYKGDNLKLIKTLPDRSINLIYFDPPFATTKNSWDTTLNWTELFPEMFRVLKDTGMIVIHCSQPFTYKLIREAPVPPLYNWTWDKGQTTNPFLANYQPLRQCEEILVWKKKKTTYYPQRVGNEIRILKSHGNSSYYGNTSDQAPKEVVGKLQTHLIRLPRETRGFSTRPIALIELMLRSYTVEGDAVLDLTCYKGVSGLVARRMGRRWIGFDLNFFPVMLMGPEALP